MNANKAVNEVGVAQLVINPTFEPRLSRGVSAFKVPNGTEALPGWWVVPAPAGENATASSVVPKRGHVLFTGPRATSLVQPLPEVARDVRVTVRLRVVTGSVQIVAANQHQTMPSVLVAANTRRTWQTVELGSIGDVDQVLITIAENETAVELASVTATPLDESGEFSRSGGDQSIQPAVTPDAIPPQSGSDQKTSPPPNRQRSEPDSSSEGLAVGVPVTGPHHDPSGGQPQPFLASPATSVAPAAAFSLDHADRDASVTVQGSDPTPVNVRQQFGVGINANEGIVWTQEVDTYPNGKPRITWSSEPAVVFTGSWRVDFDTGESGTATALGSAIAITVATGGIHTATARASSSGGDIVSRPLRFIAATPAITVDTPAPGALIAVHEAGTEIAVHATVPSSAAWPGLTVTAYDDARSGSNKLPFNPITLDTDGKGTLTLGGAVIGPRTITFTASLGVGERGWESKSTVPIAVTDPDAPVLTVLKPVRGASVVWDLASPNVRLTGTATDHQSGPAAVETSLDVNGPWHPAALTAGADPATATWTATETLVGLGETTIYIRGRDVRGNQTPAISWPVKAVHVYLPTSLADRLSDYEYLSALVAFTNTQVQVAGNKINAQQLEAALHQPLVRLTDLATIGSSTARNEINELLVPVELLRDRLADLDPALEGPAITAYLPRAYDALLTAVGTSYDEVRVARTADDSTRQALADRLGITLHGPDATTTRPDQLDILNIGPEALREKSLENLFGAPQTAPGLDRLRTLAQPQLLTWQLSAQSARWSAEQTTGFPGRAFTVILDPDIVTDQDLPPGVTSAQDLGTILTRRAAELLAIQAAVGAVVTATRDPATQLAGVLTAAHSTFTAGDIDTWNTTEMTGGSVTIALQAAGLDRPGYRWLSTIRRLTSQGLSPTPDEWTNTTDVLVGAYRRRAYATWASEESGVILGPDQFTAGASPDHPTLRISAQARADWVAVLVTRTLQRDSLVAGADGIVSASHRSALPGLRDDLLQILAAQAALDGAALGDALTRQLFVDVLASGTLTTSRLTQAIDSLRTLLLLVRAQDIPSDAPEAGWSLTAGTASFDGGWIWMASAGTWQEAVTGFLFPEAHLTPDQVTDATATDGPPRAGFKANLVGPLRLITATSDPLSVTTIASDYVEKCVLTHLTPILGAEAAHFGWLSDRDATYQARLADWSKRVWDANPDLALEVFWAAPTLIAQTLLVAGHPQLALDWLWVLYPYTSPETACGFHVMNTERDTGPVQPDLTMAGDWTDKLNPLLGDWTGKLNPRPLITGRPAPFLRSTLLAIASSLISYGDSEFATENTSAISLATTLYQSAQRVLAHPRFASVTPQNPDEGPLPIPLLETLRLRAVNQLAKIRQGRNIAGLPRTIPLPAGATAGQPITEPTPYRYRTLMARAQQQTQQSVQFEAQYLSLLERFDAATLKLDDAQFAAGLAGLQDTAASARVTEALDARQAADDQATKATAMVTTYQDAVTDVQTPQETALLQDYADMRDIQDVIAGTDALVAGAQLAVQAAGGALFSAGGTVAAAAWGAGGIVVKSFEQLGANELQRRTQADALRNGIEQQKRSLTIQLTSARQDLALAQAGQQIAADHVSLTKNEQDIVAAQGAHARTTLALLSTQFTNPDLYHWMSTTLGSIYRYFLQTATATGRLAQSQLAFDRGEPEQSFIAVDYWQQPGQLDAHGMTGAERLTEDLSQLDDYAFRTDTRLLNISTTFSLAQLSPQKLLDFRRTGQLVFSTGMDLFDQEFPGHYLRLIKQVQMSLVALVPPARGIRATLSSSGISRLVTRDRNGVFTTRLIQREPTTIVATAPGNATGVFPLDLQPDLARPFEGSGVDTSWRLDMPIAANPFSYDGIADVLLTLDYTALADPGYQAQVTTALNADRTRRSDRLFSLSRDFPDQWYTLNNPPNGRPRVVDFALTEADFPVGMETIVITAVAVRLVAESIDQPVPVTLTLTPPPPAGSIGGVADTALDGIASTRRGAPAWNPQIGQHPFGQWHLEFDSTADALFATGVDDIVFNISWQAQSPAWPT